MVFSLHCSRVTKKTCWLALRMWTRLCTRMWGRLGAPWLLGATCFLGSVYPAYHTFHSPYPRSWTNSGPVMGKTKKKVDLDSIREILVEKTTSKQWLDSCIRWRKITGINLTGPAVWNDVTNCGSTANAMLDVIPREFYGQSIRRNRQERQEQQKRQDQWLVSSSSISSITPLSDWLTNNQEDVLIQIVSNPAKIESFWKHHFPRLLGLTQTKSESIGHAAIVWRRSGQWYVVCSDQSRYSITSQPNIAITHTTTSEVLTPLKFYEERNHVVQTEGAQYISSKFRKVGSSLSFGLSDEYHGYSNKQFQFIGWVLPASKQYVKVTKKSVLPWQRQFFHSLNLF